MQSKWKGSILLLMAAMIWGAGFVAQSESMNYIGPFTMQAARFFLAGLVLLPVIAFCDAKGKTLHRPVTKQEKKHQLLAGLGCGGILFCASFLQMLGLIYTSVGKSGFITALYIIFVPIAGLLFKRFPPKLIWLSVTLSVVGLYFLCMSGDWSVNIGDLFTLLCAVVFAAHILFIDHVAGDTDGIRLSCTQFFTVSILSAVGMLIFEKPDLSVVLSCWLPICYSGILSAGVGYTLQILGQAMVPGTLASLIMSLESVFAAIFGWLLLHQRLSPKELIGCGLMFTAIILAQLPEPETKQKK